MCTLTWLIHKKGYEVFFNRDEQLSRPRATPPCFAINTKSIMPVDPQSKGTWIAVNSCGVSLCLLNNYQAYSDEKTVTKNNENYTSRGLIIPALLQLQTSDHIYHKLKKINLVKYLPFSLCVFSANLNTHTTEITIYQWDGIKLSQLAADQPVVSSAVLLTEVKQQRSDLFNQVTKQNANSKDHLAYHSSHKPEKGKYSVCMHRQDACTQSLSHISVNNSIVFRYHDGPPCEDEHWSETKMEKSV